MNSTTGSEYTENIYIIHVHLKAFAAQSSLSKVRNDNVQNAVRTRGTCAVPTRQRLCCIHKPGTRYSGTVPRLAPIMIYSTVYNYVQLHIDDAMLLIINPRRACAARVTVVGSVCLLSHISPMERLFVLKTLSRTQRATKVKKFVGFSLKPLRCRDPALPPLYGHAYSRPFFHAYFSCTRMRISRVHDTRT